MAVYKLKESKSIKESGFDYDESSEDDRTLYDAISMFFADKFCDEFELDINEVSQFSSFESLMEMLVKIVKQGKASQ